MSDVSAAMALQVRLHTTIGFNQKLSYSPHASEKQSEKTEILCYLWKHEKMYERFCRIELGKGKHTVFED